MVIARMADRQHGVVSRAQLLGAGLTSKQVGGRLRRGLLVPLHRGVYAVGHRRLTREGHWLAAVFAAGKDARLSHRDAAALHGFGQWSNGRIDVTTTADVVAKRELHVYSRRRLDPDDVATVSGIPVTTVARTFVDLAELIDRERLLHLLGEAERRRQLDLTAVEAALARAHGRRGYGQANLRAALDETGRRGLQLTRSDLEIAMRRLVRQHRLPAPRLNAKVDGEEVDAYWSSGRIAVEADGWEFHRGRAAFARDRAKSNKLTLLGHTVLRFTHDDIVHRPAKTAAAIRQALAGR